MVSPDSAEFMLEQSAKRNNSPNHPVSRRPRDAWSVLAVLVKVHPLADVEQKSTGDVHSFSCNSIGVQHKADI